MRSAVTANVRFGRLTTVSISGKNKHGVTTWLCHCDCGGTKIVPTHYLVGNRTKSCGCLNRDSLINKRNVPKSTYIKPEKQTPEQVRLNEEYGHVCRGHKDRGFTCSPLPREDFDRLIREPCYYCGVIGSKELNYRSRRYKFSVTKVNGLDRVDSSLGYTSDNVVPCCTMCNRAKMEHSQEDFLTWIERVYNYMRENNGLRRLNSSFE